jgi:hypothetical protein
MHKKVPVVHPVSSTTRFSHLKMIWNALENTAITLFWVWVVFSCVLVLFSIFFHLRKDSLEQKIDRHRVLWLERETECDDEHLQTIPEAVLDNPNALQHQKCSILISNYATSDRSADHFTQLLRHLAYFCSGLLPGCFHRLDSEGYQQSTHRIAFAEGEPLGDLFTITKRSPTRIEASLERESVDIKTTRLVVMHLDVTASKGAVLILETLQWRSDGKDEDLLPDELPWFLPSEIKVAGFLFYGAQYLETTIPTPQVEAEKLDDNDSFVMVHPLEECAA